MQYKTWYEFKRECERRLGYCLHNRAWLNMKPRAPLPWNDAQLKETLARQGHNRKRERQLFKLGLQKRNIPRV